jgi:hypothetical protein
MRLKVPSPALVISIIALCVALGGSATAATVLIKSSKQVRQGSIESSDIKNGTVKGADIAAGTISGSKLAKGAIGNENLTAAVRNQFTQQGLSAIEVVRKAGPQSKPGSVRVATLAGLAPGTYAILAKSSITPINPDRGVLGELDRDQKTIGGHCVLEAAGDRDDATAAIVTPFSSAPRTLNMQMTRTLSSAADVTVTCDSDGEFRASDTSIIALKLAGSSRNDVTG